VQKGKELNDFQRNLLDIEIRETSLSPHTMMTVIDTPIACAAEEPPHVKNVPSTVQLLEALEC